MLTDACCVASGCFGARDWHHSTFHADLPQALLMHINYKEVCAVADFVAQLALMWVGQTVMVRADSAVTKAIQNKGRSKHAYINDVLWLICWKAVSYDFELHTIRVPGSLSCIPDAISQLHEPGQEERLVYLPSYWHHGCRPPSPHRGTHVTIIIPFSASTGEAAKLVKDFQTEVASFKAETFAYNTKRTYATHRDSYFEFSAKLCVPPILASQETIAMYVAYLA